MVSFEDTTNLHRKILPLNTTINDSNRAWNVLFNVVQRLEPITVVWQDRCCCLLDGDNLPWWCTVWKIDLGSVNLNIREKPRNQARAQKSDLCFKEKGVVSYPLEVFSPPPHPKISPVHHKVRLGWCHWHSFSFPSRTSNRFKTKTPHSEGNEW